MNLSVRHKKLKAFTLLELLVGMILSGIVLAATFTAYRVVTRQYESYSSKSKSITEISLFTSQLEADVENAATITRGSENKILLQSSQRILEYRFSEKHVLRNDQFRTDTFTISVTQIETFYKSEKVNSENSEIDELRVRMNYEGKTEEKNYIKTKDPKTELDKIDQETILSD